MGNVQSWSLEALVALQPDRVWLWGSGTGMDTLATLERLGIPVFVSEPRRLADIPYTIMANGKLAGTQATSETEAQRIELSLSALQRQYRRQQPVSVF